jgi:plasmid rolling circle replication initiator protein Rep
VDIEKSSLQVYNEIVKKSKYTLEGALFMFVYAPSLDEKPPAVKQETAAKRLWRRGMQAQVNTLPLVRIDETIDLPICEGTGEVLHDTNGRRELPWRRHKVTSAVLVNLFREALKIEPALITEKRLVDLKDCASFLEFLRGSKQDMKLKRANFCKLRLCPMCSWRRSMKLFGQTALVATEILKQQPKTRFLFLTLTVKNCSADKLSGTLKMMDNGFQYLTASSRNFVPARVLKKNLLGYMKATEITYNQRENTYHPHLHVILAIRESYFHHDYIKKSEWVTLWQQAMKLDYAPSVHIETVKDSRKGMAGAVAETAKYPVKVADLLEITDKEKSVSALIALHEAMQNRRMVTFGGLFKTIRAELRLQDVDTENVDLNDTDQEDENVFKPIERVFFRWHAKIGAYIC